MFPFFNLFCMFFSVWVAFDKRFRNGDPRIDWWLFYFNLGAAALNGACIFYWIFN